VILSEFGEGYCRVCHFVVGLVEDGRLIFHERGRHSNSIAACDGSGRKPSKVTPYASRLAAFKTKAPLVACPGCGHQVTVASYPSGPLIARHIVPFGSLCPGSHKKP